MAQEVTLPLGRLQLQGTLTVPDGARGLVLFAHGSGSSRFSPRNRFVAEELNHQRLGTLLFDLLTREEEMRDAWTAELRFDIQLLAERLVAAADWCEGIFNLGFGLFGSSTGAAAALVAAACRPDAVRAVVSRGGRSDLAGEDLPFVRAPTLLIVGGDDEPVLALNRAALRQLEVNAEIKIIPGATHLFEEPGALEEVAELAGQWFIEHLTQVPRHVMPH